MASYRSSKMQSSSLSGLDENCQTPCQNETVVKIEQVTSLNCRTGGVPGVKEPEETSACCRRHTGADLQPSDRTGLLLYNIKHMPFSRCLYPLKYSDCLYYQHGWSQWKLEPFIKSTKYKKKDSKAELDHCCQSTQLNKVWEQSISSNWFQLEKEEETRSVKRIQQAL